MSRFLKGKRGKAKFKNAHEAFKNISKVEAKSLRKIASANAQRKRFLKKKISDARCTSYGLFTENNWKRVCNARRKTFKGGKKLFAAVSKKIAANYRRLSPREHEYLSMEAAKRRSRALDFIKCLMNQQK